MASLSVRTIKHYFMRSLMLLGGCLGVLLLLSVELVLINSDGSLDIVKMSRTVILCEALAIFLVNSLYSLYGVSWFDSIVLSMGSLRKYIFWGEILQNNIVVCGGLIISFVGITVFNQYNISTHILMLNIMALPSAALFNIIGHKLQRYGRAVVIVLVIISTLLGGSIGASTVMDGDGIFAMIHGVPFIGVSIGAVIVFLLLEIWVYKLYKQMMVC